MFAHYTNQELVDECHRRGLAFGPVLTPADLATDPALAARGFFVEVVPPVKVASREGGAGHEDSSGSRPNHFPGAPYRFGETPWAIASPPPSLPAPSDRVAWRPRQPEPELRNQGPAPDGGPEPLIPDPRSPIP